MAKILWLAWRDKEHPLAGGAEVVGQKLTEKLVADGHTVEFIVGGFKGGASYVEEDGHKITRLGNRYTVYALTIFHYFKHLRKNKYDIIIDEVNTAPFFASWYMKKKNVKHFLFFHQLAREIWFYQMPWVIGWIGYVAEAGCLRLLSISSPEIITISKSTKNDLKRFGFKDGKINIISEGLDDDGANIRPIKDLNDIEKYSKKTIISFGAVRAMKRTLEIVKAFEILKKSIDTPFVKGADKLSLRKLSGGFSGEDMVGLRLIIAGDINNSYARAMIEYIEKSPFKKDIEVLGRVTAERKKELMQRAHLIAATSIKEGWGLIVTEANSQGTPAVVYNVDGLRDAVRHNETGLIASENTPREMAKVMQKMLTDKELYDKIRIMAWTWSKGMTFEQSYKDFKKNIILNTEKIKNGREFDWLVFAEAYFQSALISIRILQSKNSKFGTSKCCKEFYGNNYNQSPGYLVSPVIFNFKHGIEIYLKIIAGLNPSSNEFIKIHDLMDLYRDANINNKSLKKVIEKYYKSKLFVVNSERGDEMNSFERYPQDTPYDGIELFEVVSIDKINTLLKDIEYVYKTLRAISIKILHKDEKSSLQNF